MQILIFGDNVSVAIGLLPSYYTLLSASLSRYSETEHKAYVDLENLLEAKTQILLKRELMLVHSEKNK